MRQPVVADLSVLMDLCRGRLLERFHALGFDVRMSDLMAEEEMSQLHVECPGHRWPTETLLGDELEDLQRLLDLPLNVSSNDVSALLIAKRIGGTLLTGDGDLRKLAQSEKVACHGLLWCLDRMEVAGVDARTLDHALSTLIGHRRVRLPRAEVQIRLARYRSTAILVTSASMA